MGKRKSDSEDAPDMTAMDEGTPYADPLSSNDASLGSAPTAAEAEKAVQKAEAEKTKEAAPPPAPKPVVPFRVFASLSGMKADQLAAFASFVRREELRAMSVEDWRATFAAFRARPVKSLRKG